MPLKESVDFVTWPELHYVFVEKAGPIPKNAPLAWQEFHELRPQIETNNTITGFLSLYKLEPQVYRAGVTLTAPPAGLPKSVKYERFGGSKYARFVLTGSYTQLPQATRRVFEIVSEKKFALRNDFHIENYVSDPRNTPEEKLVTEILFPVE